MERLQSGSEVALSPATADLTIFNAGVEARGRGRRGRRRGRGGRTRQGRHPPFKPNATISLTMREGVPARMENGRAFPHPKGAPEFPRKLERSLRCHDDEATQVVSERLPLLLRECRRIWRTRQKAHRDQTRAAKRRSG